MQYNILFLNRKNIFAPIFTLFICALCSFNIGCTNENKESESKLNKDIMAVHEEIMPKMSEINRLKRQLGRYKDSVSDDNAEMKDSLINTILMLSKMEDGMSDWMEHYRYPNPDISHDEMIKYLTGQRDTVKHLSDDIFMSIAVANGFLKNAPKDSTTSQNSTEK
jgi:hypothetical protein